MSILIRNARILDGTGAPWFPGDVLIEGERIAAVAPKLDANGAEVVDAAGRYLAPGFIDAHAHDDLIYLRQPGRPEKVAQGVTTVVVGNCSFGLYPQTPASADGLREHFGNLLGTVRPEESFADFAAYRASLDGRGIAINLVSLVGHAALRLAVMGWQNRAATPEEREAMAALLAEQFRQGAHGLSLGLVYPPSAWADTAELVRLAEVVAEHGALLTAHVRSYEGGLIASVDEFLDLLKAGGASGLLSHLQAAGRPYWGSLPRAVERLEIARKDGVDVSFDMYPYPAGSSTILQLLPPSALAGGVEALLARMADPDGLAALRRAVEEGEAPADAGWESKIRLIGWENVRIGGVGEESFRALEGLSLAEIAGTRRETPFETLSWLIAADRGRTNIVMFQLSEDDLDVALSHPLHMLGSDGLPRETGKPHPRAFGAFPRYLARALRGEGGLGLEDTVRHMTAVPAQRFGLTDRGLVRPGMVADLTLFTADASDRATFRDPTRLPHGITDVLVAGRFVLRDGEHTGARPGRTLARA
ncbi:N-acyl-D-amino-acid deacylase family protein [Azospirillum rugosum]|uniref:N-acyl-D-amino-acid deacylase n=1 Tax=Azospirillum rugosum TaxID=416170 RepID=A0ABS4SW29_9PROT|nr:D-aminoacylase [Azospirillum rugosum]MBP2296434.1 N-acyl-D-amino-acid deacylase [Azospirillum rugosum]MDQ0529955.1 N-acyl-D-amino-acid deacylase [Azospirillum rugosum]